MFGIRRRMGRNSFFDPKRVYIVYTVRIGRAIYQGG